MSIRKAGSLFLVLVVCTFTQGNGTGGVDLVIDSNLRVSKIHSVEFTRNSTLRVVATSGQQTIVSEIGGQNDSIDFTARTLPHRAVSVAGQMLGGLSPLQAEIFDLKQQHRVKTVEVKGIDAWPLVCHDRDFCAWQSGNQIHVAPLLGGDQARDYPLQGSVVLSLDISPDGQLLAAGINQARVRVWGHWFPSVT